MSTLLVGEGLTKHFKGLMALSHVSFRVERDEILGIIGPNGAGKTTLFNLITGYLRPDEGSITFNATPITRASPHAIVRRGLARTFQIPRPFKSLTVAESVEVARAAASGTVLTSALHERGAITEQVLRLVHLWDLRDQQSGTLSQGDLKRLELARALATNPILLLLDEPYAGLSPGETSHLTAAIQELHRKGLTLVIIEHKLRELMKLCHRVLVLHYGEKIADGTPAEIAQDDTVLKAYMGGRRAAFGA